MNGGARKILWAIEKESGTRIKIGGEIGDEVVVSRGSRMLFNAFKEP